MPTLDDLLNAMRTGQSIDASACCLSGGDWRFSSILPAFQLAAFQIADASTTAGTSTRQADLTARDFERLSLAVRAWQFGSGGGHPLDDALAALNLTPNLMPIVEVEDIERAINTVAAEVEGHEGAGPRTPQGWRGLQIIGARIKTTKGDVARRGLRLINARLPFSLSFVGCLFDAPVLADACQLMSLDLSGSSMPGLQADGLRTTGGLHLRRATVLTPIQLSGVRIGGRLDAADLLAFPARRRTADQPVSGDHGVLNLNQAVIENELRLDRARLWGGLSLRGATVHRSVVLTGAVIASPLGVLEKRAFDGLHQRVGGAPAPGHGVEPLGGFDRSMAARVLHSPVWPPPGSKTTLAHADALARLECLDRTAVWDDETLADMLSESLRARISAVRADALTVHGDLNSEHAMISGRFRMRYANVQGAGRFGAATVQSAATCRRELARLVRALETPDAAGARALRELRTRSGGAFSRTYSRHIFFPQDFSFDLRNSSFGTVDFGLGEATEPALIDRRRTFYAADLPEELGFRDYAWLTGPLCLTGAAISGSLDAKELAFAWRPAGFPLPVGEQADTPAKVDRWWRGLREQASGNGNAVPRERARLSEADQLYLRSTPTVLDRCCVILQRAQIGDDVDLRKSRGIWGVDLRDALIQGNLLLSSKNGQEQQPSKGTVQRQTESTRVICKDRAFDLRGGLDLGGAEIKGDAYLVFSESTGPNIKGAITVVAGRLDIYPARPLKGSGEEQNGFLWIDSDDEAKRKEAARRLRNRCPPQRRERPEKGHAWYIDLRNSRAAVFAHPPEAWPKHEALSLDGFKYERSSNLGPLPPIARQPQTNTRLPGLWAVQEDSDVGDRRRGLVERALMLLLVALISTLLWQGVLVVNAGLRAILPAVPPVDTAWGGVIWLLLTLQFMWVWIGSHRRRPDILAIRYLDRHRREWNRYRMETAPLRYVPLDPYITAAKVLRDSGRTASADEVELTRMSRQTELLSWRRHGLLKAFLLMVAWTAGYGFKPGRFAGWVLFATLLSAVTFHSLANVGWLTPEPEPAAVLQGEVTSMSGGMSELILTPQVEEPPPDPPGLLYALDKLLPGVDLNTHEWAASELLPRTQRSFINLLAPLLELVGTIFTALFTVAVVARVQSALALSRA